MCVCVCKQQRGGSRVSASCWGVQQLCDWGFLSGGPRPEESEPSRGLSGMLLWEKDPGCVWVCRSLWICFQWKRCRTPEGVTAFIPWPVYTVRMAILPETHTKGKYFITKCQLITIIKIYSTQCFPSEGVLSITCWPTQHWELNTSRKVSRHTICH